MSLHEALFAVNRFVLDALEVAARLDSVTTHGDPEVISESIRSGHEEYEKLTRRRAAMCCPVADAPLIQTALDNLQARLKFLEVYVEKKAYLLNR